MPEINTGFPFMLAREIQVSSLGPQHLRMFHLRMFHFDGAVSRGRSIRAGCCPAEVIGRRSGATSWWRWTQLIVETNDNYQIYPAWKGLGHLKVCAMVEDHCSAASALPSVGPQLT
jgi:hypothetical protein